MDNKYTFEELSALAESLQDRGVAEDVQVFMQVNHEPTLDCLISGVNINFGAIANLHHHLLLDAGPRPLLAVLNGFGCDPLTINILAPLLTRLIAQAKAEEAEEAGETAVDTILEEEVIG